MAAGRLMCFKRGLRKVETGDKMTALHQIGGHWSTHIAKANETDLGHDIPSPNYFLDLRQMRTVLTSNRMDSNASVLRA
jgi:hypothetical protein